MGALLSVKESANFLGVSQSTFRRFFWEGKIKGLRLGTKILRFRADELERFLAMSTAGEESPQ